MPFPSSLSVFWVFAKTECQLLGMRLSFGVGSCVVRSELVFGVDGCRVVWDWLLTVTVVAVWLWYRVLGDAVRLEISFLISGFCGG